MEKGRGVDKSEKGKWPKSLGSFLLIRYNEDDLKTMFEQQKRRRKNSSLLKFNKVNIKGEERYLVLQIGQFT